MSKEFIDDLNAKWEWISPKIDDLIMDDVFKFIEDHFPKPPAEDVMALRVKSGASLQVCAILLKITHNNPNEALALMPRGGAYTDLYQKHDFIRWVRSYMMHKNFDSHKKDLEKQWNEKAND